MQSLVFAQTDATVKIQLQNDHTEPINAHPLRKHYNISSAKTGNGIKSNLNLICIFIITISTKYAQESEQIPRIFKQLPL